MAFQHLAVSVHMELSICPHPRFLAEPQHLEIWGWIMIKTYQNPYFIQLYNVIQTLDNVRQCHVVIGYTVTPYSGLTSKHPAIPVIPSHTSAILMFTRPSGESSPRKLHEVLGTSTSQTDTAQADSWPQWNPTRKSGARNFAPGPVTTGVCVKIVYP